jgi:hypothetical protein
MGVPLMIPAAGIRSTIHAAPVASNVPVSVVAAVENPIAVAYGPARAVIDAVTAPDGCKNGSSAALFDASAGLLLLARTPFDPGASNGDDGSPKSPEEMANPQAGA